MICAKRLCSILVYAHFVSKVIKLDVANFLYVTQSQGTSEDRIKCIIKEVEQSGDVIHFVKEVQNIFEATSSRARSFAYILKHALEKGVIQVGIAILIFYRTSAKTSKISLDPLFS